MAVTTVSPKAKNLRALAAAKDKATPTRAKKTPAKEAAARDAFDMQELRDQLAAAQAELSAVKAKEGPQRRKALAEINAAVQEDEDNDTVRIERPKGSAGDGFKLRQVMGLGDKVARYRRIQRTIRRCIDKAGLRDDAPFRTQDIGKLGNVYKARPHAREKHPYLRRFVNDWATAEFVKMLLKNRRAQLTRRTRRESAADDVDMENDDF
ncbi:hypothetical protein EXIGLDRAFT_700982 [Exidia glandulosa HHB12029]|uniref:Uncharacterized protein n=1 Tax=Exidia glandulosa HHB12029 TaxID=1314781 RepID=A0A165LX94_EXIGL|nr:hypothetical protein EXIGLDRAFT_700982 [Exidia glandulosa HHB12029]